MRYWTEMTFFDYLNYLALILMSLIMLYPFVYALSESVSSIEAVGARQVILFPKGFDLKVYEDIFNTNTIATAYRNSIVYTAMSTVFTLAISVLGGYVLSERRFRWRSTVSLILGLTLFFSAGLIPTYLTYNSYGLVNTIWAVTLPRAFTFWYIILVRTNFQSIPQELKDAARVDGADDFAILFQIMIPLSTAILATIALFAAVGCWNDYFRPLIYLDKSNLQPLPVILQRLLIAGGTQDILREAYRFSLQTGYLEKVKMATLIVATLPILITYPFVQKYFVKGVLIGSIKG
jgi:putative aldouronate transport system permease protein